MSGLRTTAAAVGLVWVLAACGGGGSSSGDPGDGATSGPTTSTPTTVAAPPPAPKIGACRDLSFAEISLFSNDSKPVPCGKAHTAYTFDVSELPSKVAFEGVEIRNDAVQDAAAKICNSAYADFVGGDSSTRALARLTVTYFVPDQEGFDAGAHWVRCDIVALRTETALGPLPEKLAGFLDREEALDEYGVCSQGAPSERGSALVMCTQEHTYRAVAAFRLGEDDDLYPGEDDTLEAGQDQCEDFIKELLDVSGGFTYSWTYPSPDDWLDGQRFGYCWNESAS